MTGITRDYMKIYKHAIELKNIFLNILNLSFLEKFFYSNIVNNLRVFIREITEINNARTRFCLSSYLHGL